MHPAPQLNEIDVIVAGACIMAWLTLVLLWRQRRQITSLRRLQARLGRERVTREQAEQALADTRRQVCHLSASQQSLRDAERRRIARDLHDDLGQQLLTLTLDLDALARQHPAVQVALALRRSTWRRVSVRACSASWRAWHSCARLRVRRSTAACCRR